MGDGLPLDGGASEGERAQLVTAQRQLLGSVWAIGREGSRGRGRERRRGEIRILGNTGSCPVLALRWARFPHLLLGVDGGPMSPAPSPFSLR